MSSNEYNNNNEKKPQQVESDVYDNEELRKHVTTVSFSVRLYFAGILQQIVLNRDIKSEAETVRVKKYLRITVNHMKKYYSHVCAVLKLAVHILGDKYDADVEEMIEAAWHK